MLYDASDVDRSLFAQTFDVCIIGAGPAGITLARTLSAKGYRIALMDGGGLEVSPESQDLYVGQSVGVEYEDLDVVRLRAFGGSSGHWSGWCRALDEYDFTALPHRPASWPIAKSDLDPYQPAASAILDLDGAQDLPDQPLQQTEKRFRHVQFRPSPPTRFGEKYRDEIAAAPGIACCLNANLIELTLGDDLATVTSALFRSYAPDDPGFTVAARAFCLCLGGLENPRMLLTMTRQKPQGIGNDQDQVGRHFCDHPRHPIGAVLLDQPARIPIDRYAPTLDFMLKEQVLNFQLRVESAPVKPMPISKSAWYAAKCLTPLTEQLAEQVLGRVKHCKWGGPDEFFVRHDPANNPVVLVRMQIETAIRPDSRVMLADTRDSLGLRQIKLDWRLSEIDYHTMETAVLALGAQFAEQDTGRLKVLDWILAEPPAMPGKVGADWNGAPHHMCTTRMADDPREGVVDRDCRVHGMDNLYIGGSSVFATPGYTTPTYTIVMLALRLSDHLAATLA